MLERIRKNSQSKYSLMYCRTPISFMSSTCRILSCISPILCPKASLADASRSSCANSPETRRLTRLVDSPRKFCHSANYHSRKLPSIAWHSSANPFTASSSANSEPATYSLNCANLAYFEDNSNSSLQSNTYSVIYNSSEYCFS